MKFRISHLLLGMCLVAIVAYFTKQLYAHEFFTVLIMYAACGAAGLAVGWLARGTTAVVRSRSLALPVLSLSAVNVACWGLHRLAMSGIERNTFDLDFPAYLQNIIWIDHLFAFEVVAMSLGVAILWQGFQRDTSTIGFIGGTVLLFWSLHFALGFLVVGLTLGQWAGLS